MFFLLLSSVVLIFHKQRVTFLQVKQLTSLAFTRGRQMYQFADNICRYRAITNTSVWAYMLLETYPL